MDGEGGRRFEPLASGDIAAFVAAVETGTVQGAAEAIHLTQSAATKRIQSLERRLGTQLLERGRDGVRPTAAGRRLYPDAQRALEALDAGAEAARGHTESNVIRLAASRTAGGFVLPELLAGFRRQHPAYRSQVDVLNSPQVLELVGSGKATIGFTEGETPPDELESTMIARDELVVVVAASHPWAGREHVSARDLPGERYVSREPGSGTRSVSERLIQTAGVSLSPDLELASLAGVKRALEDGGFTVISNLAVAIEVRAGTLGVLRVADIDMTRDIVAVRQRVNPDVASETLWRWLRRQAIFGSSGSPY